MLLRRLRSLSALAALVSVAVVAGCGKDSGTGPKHVGPPANLTIVSGDQQQAAVGAEIPSPLVIKVVDASGNAIQGQTVNFRVTAGGGSVFAGASTTNADGIAQERWTLGTVAGQEQIVEARAVDNTTGQALVFATFHATAVAGPAKALAITAQPAATVKAGDVLSRQPVVQLVDQYGNAVKQSGVNVTVAVAPAAGHTLEGTATVATNAQGMAQFTDLKLTGASGAVTLAFSAPSLTSVASNQFLIAAGSPATLEPLVETTVTGTVGTEVSALPAVVVKDASGNGVPGVTVLFALSTGGGTINPTSAKTDVNGHVVLNRWTLPTTPGTYAVVASISELSGTSVTFTATVQPGPASQLVTVSGNGTPAGTGETVTLVARANDLFGNPVAGVTVNWGTVGNSGTLSASSSVTDASGKASISLTVPSTATTAQVVASIQGGASVTFTVPVSSHPTRIVSLIGTTDEASVGFVGALPVQVLDEFNNPVAGVTVTWTILSGGGTLSATTAITDGSGKAEVKYTFPTQVGTAQIKESIPSGASVTIAAQAVPLGPSSVTKVEGDGLTAAAGTAVSPSPVVLVSDQYGNPVPNVPVAFSVTSGGGSISGGSTATDNTGKATAGTWILGASPGTNTVKATAAGLSVSFTATGIVGPGAKLLVGRQPSSAVVTGAPFPVQPIVQLADQYGNAVNQAGITVTASSTASGIALQNTNAITDANGQAAFSGLTATGPSGTFTIQFSSSGLQSATSNTISLASGQGTTISALNGVTSFSTTAGVPLSAPYPAVLVTDAQQNPVAGIPVTFSLEGVNTTVNSGADGVAQFSPALYAAGSHTITATATGLSGSPVTFTVAVAPGPVYRLVAGTPVYVPPISSFTYSLFAYDQYGNAVPGVTVNWSVTVGMGTATLTPASSTTDASGRATVTITGSGLVYFRATVPGTSLSADIGPVELGNATTRTWVGGTPGAERSWIYGTNWSPAGVPTSSDAVTIPQTAYTPQLSRSVTIASLSIANGAALDLNGYDLTLGTQRTASSFLSGQIQGAGNVIATGGSKVTINGATTLPNLLIQNSSILDLNGQLLTVNGDLTQNDPRGTALMGGGRIVVYGKTFLSGNSLSPVPALDLKGDLTTATCAASFGRCTILGGSLSLSGTTHQNVLLRDPFSIVSIGPVTAAPGTDVTFAAGTSRTVTIAGNLDLYGNFAIPAGTVVNVQGTITLHSGSTTTVNGTLTGSSCVKDVLNVTYSGFSCP